jgi:hypothetical protein
LNVNNNKRNNSRQKQSRHSYHQQQHHRNQLDDVKNSDRSSASENDINQAQETDYSVGSVETNLSDLTLNDSSYMVYHI